MGAVSPTARSLKYLRERGYLCQVVEKFNPGARVRQDAYGFGDILAIRDDATLLVQSCTVGDQSKRIAKILAEPRAILWARGRDRYITVHGWGLHGARGARKTWDVTTTEISLNAAGDLVPQEDATRGVEIRITPS